MLKTEILWLDAYLMLQRSRHLLAWSETETIAFLPSELQFKSINILVPLLGIEDQDESILAEFLAQRLKDHFPAWFGFIFLVEENCVSEIDLYLNLVLSQIVTDSPDLENQLTISILDSADLILSWDNIYCRLDAFCTLYENDLPDKLGSRLNILPKLMVKPEQTILESLYQSRLEKAFAFEQIAAEAFAQEHWSEAIVFYQKAINYNPFKSIFWANLASVYFKLQDFSTAKTYIQKAIVLDSPQSFYYNTSGLIHEQLHELDLAVEAYQKAIVIDPKDANSYCNLGSLFARLNQYSEAEEIYQSGIEANPWHFGLYLNLGNLYLQSDRPSEAIVQYQIALKYAPNNPDVFANLAIATQKTNIKQSLFYQAKQLELEQNYQDSIEKYKQVIQLDSLGLNAYLGVCRCYQNLKQFSTVRTIVEQVFAQILHKQDDRQLLDFLSIKTLLTHLNHQDEFRLSQNLIQKSKLFEEPLLSNLFSAVNLPILYESESEAEFYREELIHALDALDTLDLAKVNSELFTLSHLLVHAFTNYQCKDDLEIQKKYANIVEKILAIRYPQFTHDRSITDLKNRKIRLGYISNHLRLHNGARWAVGWLKHHDRSRFEIYTYHLGNTLDGVTQQFCEKADRFEHIPSEDFSCFSDWLDHTVHRIAQDQLDILIFPDIGMEVKTILLSKLRLAPIQCTAWGHPVTSGSSYVDYYLSSHLMEPDMAQNHYTEKLIRLPNLGLCYPYPPAPEPTRNRSFFNLPEGRILYLSCQSLFKYLPQYDFIYPAIAQQVPNAYFVFLETFYLQSKFSNRLEKVFAQEGLSSHDYCQILPGQSWENYIQLQYVTDIYLDTIGWTGGNSTLEAIVCGLPVVTCPGELMRGRHSYGILQNLGVTETIAHSLAEYVQIAVELGINQPWRESISAKYKLKHDRLFDDRLVTQALDQVLSTLILDK